MKINATEHFGLILVVLTLGLLAFLSFFIGMDTMKAWVLGAGVYAPIAFIILKASTIVIAPLAGGPVYPLVGAFFGLWPGVLYVAIGDFLGFTISFFISRKFGYPIVAKLIAKNEHGLLKKIVEHAGTMRGFRNMILAFFAMPELISYGTGLSKLSYWKFIMVLWPLSWIGSIILVFVGATLGASSESALFSLAVPLVAFVVIGFGAWLFVRGIREKV